MQKVLKTRDSRDLSQLMRKNIADHEVPGQFDIIRMDGRLAQVLSNSFSVKEAQTVKYLSDSSLGILDTNKYKLKRRFVGSIGSAINIGYKLSNIEIDNIYSPVPKLKFNIINLFGEYERIPELVH